MNKLFFFILMTVSVLAAPAQNQTDAQGLKQGFWQKKYPNGKPQFEGFFVNNKPVGEFKRYHENGKLKAIMVHAEKSDSATAQLFDQTGTLMAKGSYAGQEKAGNWKYYQSGRLISEENFKEGKKEGTAKTYYPDGSLFEESQWINGLQEGIYRAFFQNGKTYLECQMKSGTRNGHCQTFFQSGEKELEAVYLAGLKHGDWHYYNEDGSLAYTLNYLSGKLLNPLVLDSVQQKLFNELDQNRGKVPDPEQFMNDPAQYMERSKMR